MASAPADPAPVKPINDPAAQPFGLPTGSVRGILSILICSFFWLVLLWPAHPTAADPPPPTTPAQTQTDVKPTPEVVKDKDREKKDARPMLAHFFLLGLVLMAFAQHPTVVEKGQSPFLPWVLRLVFVGVSVAVVVMALVQNPVQLQQRLTPEPDEVKQWWIAFLGSMSGGFALGLFLRFVLGRTSLIFRSIRAWLSVVGMVMLVIELVLFQGFIGSIGQATAFLSVWQCLELIVVAAYFGTRA